MLQQAQNKKSEHIVIVKQKAKCKLSKPTRLFKTAIISFIVGVACFATPHYLTAMQLDSWSDGITHKRGKTRQMLMNRMTMRNKVIGPGKRNERTFIRRIPSELWTNQAQAQRISSSFDSFHTALQMSPKSSSEMSFNSEEDNEYKLYHQTILDIDPDLGILPLHASDYLYWDDLRLQDVEFDRAEQAMTIYQSKQQKFIHFVARDIDEYQTWRTKLHTREQSQITKVRATRRVLPSSFPNLKVKIPLYYNNLCITDDWHAIQFVTEVGAEEELCFDEIHEFMKSHDDDTKLTILTVIYMKEFDIYIGRQHTRDQAFESMKEALSHIIQTAIAIDDKQLDDFDYGAIQQAQPLSLALDPEQTVLVVIKTNEERVYFKAERCTKRDDYIMDIRRKIGIHMYKSKESKDKCNCPIL